MFIVSMLVSVAFLSAWLWIAYQLVRALLRRQSAKPRLAKVSAALFVMAIASFFSPAASSIVPSSIEWPIGLAGDLHTTSSGMHVVGHMPSQRVQVYDANWHFQTAIHIDGRGGSMTVTILPGDLIEVITARGSQRFVFSLDGRQLSVDPAPPRTTPINSHVTFGPWVPTWPWLISLTHPFAGFSLIIPATLCGWISGSVRFGSPTQPLMATGPQVGENMSCRCPACGSQIAPENINVQIDTALCRACGHATTYSAIIHAPVDSVHTAPPEGCYVESIPGRWRAVASTRSWRAIPIALFALIWNSFVMVFVGVLVFGGVPPLLSVVVLIFMSGHIAVGAYVAWTAGCFAFGELELVIENSTLAVSTGFRPFRFTRRRALSEIRGIQQRQQPRSPAGPMVLVLDGVRPLKFGGQLTDTRRFFIHAALASQLQSSARTDTHPPVE